MFKFGKSFAAHSTSYLFFSKQFIWMLLFNRTGLGSMLCQLVCFNEIQFTAWRLLTSLILSLFAILLYWPQSGFRISCLWRLMYVCIFALCSFDPLVSVRRFLGWWVSVRHMSVCMPWTSTQITGCSGCFDVLPHSKLQGASVSSEEADSGRVSPVLTDPVIVSPRPRHHDRHSESEATQRPISLAFSLVDRNRKINYAIKHNGFWNGIFNM